MMSVAHFCNPPNCRYSVLDVGLVIGRLCTADNHVKGLTVSQESLLKSSRICEISNNWNCLVYGERCRGFSASNQAKHNIACSREGATDCGANVAVGAYDKDILS